MCPQVSKYLTKRNWLICIGLVIALLVAVGIYFLVTAKAKENAKTACKIDTKIKTPEEYVKNFGNEFIDDISKKYLDMVRRNHQNEKTFYNSIKADLPPKSPHFGVIQDILQKSIANFEKINSNENITARVELIRLSKDLSARFYSLSNTDSQLMKADNFTKILEKHGFNKLEKSKNEELYKTVKAINENWREKYRCIPDEYSKKYPEFSVIEKQFKEILASDAEKTTFKIFSLFERIDAFFDNKVKVSQFDLESTNMPPQQNNQFGLPDIGAGIANAMNRGFQAAAPIESGLKENYKIATSKLNEGKNALGAQINQAGNTLQSNFQKLNEGKNALGEQINQFGNTLETNLRKTLTNKFYRMKVPLL